MIYLRLGELIGFSYFFFFFFEEHKHPRTCQDSKPGSLWFEAVSLTTTPKQIGRYNFFKLFIHLWVSVLMVCLVFFKYIII